MSWFHWLSSLAYAAFRPAGETHFTQRVKESMNLGFEILLIVELDVAASKRAFARFDKVSIRVHSFVRELPLARGPEIMLVTHSNGRERRSIPCLVSA